MQLPEAKGDCTKLGCPYEKDFVNCIKQLCTEALVLLKEKEAEKVRCIRYLRYVKKGICPACEREIEASRYGISTNYCKYCGKEVKWE